MSKNKKAATVAATDVKTKTTTVDKKAVETKKEDVKPQVDNKSKDAKTEDVKKAPTAAKETKAEVKKDAQKSPDKPKKEKIPTIIPEEATGSKSPEKKAVERATNLISGIPTAGIPIGSSESSVDGKAMLAYVMQQRYANNEELKKQYPELYADINRSIDVVTLLALVDLRQDLFNRGERGELQLQINADQVLPLQSMADMLGIKLAPAKALPGRADGQLAINFSESEVPAELTEKKEAPADKEPELDPNKITTDEELIAALNYLISKDKNVAESIVNTVEWYRVYCGLKETNADKKLALDEKTVTDWINEIFSIIQPTAILRGLGRAVYLYTSQTGSPCMAHSIMHKHMCKAGWSEAQVAEALRALIGENFRYKLKDDPKADPKDDKALKAITGLLGNKYIDQLFADFSADTNGVEDSKKVELEAARENARKVIGSIRTNYFEKQGKNPSMDEIRMVVGQIINLYRDPADRLAEYCQDTIIAPKEGEYPEKSEKADEKKK